MLQYYKFNLYFYLSLTKDQGCLPGLVLFLDNKESEVVLLVLKVWKVLVFAQIIWFDGLIFTVIFIFKFSVKSFKINFEFFDESSRNKNFSISTLIALHQLFKTIKYLTLVKEKWLNVF